MTIFFCCIPEDGSPPFLGSDLMLTMESRGDKEADVASGRNREASQYNNVQNLSWQKLYLFHKNIAFAIAGNVSHAKKFIDRIIKESETFSIEANASFISLIDYVWNEINGFEFKLVVSFICLIYDEKENKFIQCNKNAIEIYDPRFGRVFYQGTGSFLFEEKLKGLISNERPHQKMDLEHLSVSRVVSLCCSLFADECLQEFGSPPIKK